MSGARGFTLIETLVALAILAVLLVAFYETMGTGFRMLDRAALIDEAVLIAQSELDRAVAQRRIPDERQGRAGRHVWRIDRRPFGGAAADVPLRPVLVRLWVTPPGMAREISLERIILVSRGGE
jgi:prepilin-type N-terminal cleavage/methylation domain-containing protein